MALVRLGTEHYIAINYLSLPKRGGLTMQQIANEAGVTRDAIYKWLKDPLFDRELKKAIIRNTRNRLPDVTESMVNAVIADGNAAMAKLILQMNDMLTDDIKVSDKLESVTDIDAMQERIAAYKKKNVKP